MATDEFLNPKSMLTPGIAGGVVMLVTNALAGQFNLARNWTGLLLSLAVGLIVMLQEVKPIWLRLLLYVLNSFIIFAVALGTNEAGAAAQHPVGTLSTGLAMSYRGFFNSWF